MKKNILLLLSVFTLILASCSSDDASVPQIPVNAKKDPLVKRITYTVPGQGTVALYNFTYQGNKLVKCEEPLSTGQKTMYYYTGDLITKTVRYVHNVPSIEVNFSYNAQQQLTECHYKHSDGSHKKKIRYTHQSDGTITFQSYVSGVNPAEDVFTQEGKIYANRQESHNVDQNQPGTPINQGVAQFTLDGKNHPFKNVAGFDKIGFVPFKYFYFVSDPFYRPDTELTCSDSRQNIAVGLYNSTTNYIYTITSYEYNTKGYPIIETKREAGTPELVKKEYTYY